MLEDLIPLLTGALAQKMGAYAVALLVLTWLGGKGLVSLIQKPWAHKAFAAGLKTAEVPGVIGGKWLQAGPLHVVSGPIICLLVFGGFWFFTLMDKLLSFQKPDTLKLVDSLEKILSTAGSSDRKLYIQAKTMPTIQVVAVSQMAEAVAAKPGELDAEQQKAITRVRDIGRALQAERIQE